MSRSRHIPNCVGSTPAHRARVLFSSLVIAAAVMSLGDLAGAESQSPPRATAPATVERDAMATPKPRPRTARALEVQAVLDQERFTLEALGARREAAPDAATALALQREIERVKSGTEVALLGLQATWARRAGREEAARAIEAAIRTLLESSNAAKSAASSPFAAPVLDSQSSRSAR
ncbi:MAG: hypothetical protein HOP12_05035 [Candidatus Eisenbacteria bacterium]|uniref:Uncharacterized protein n=1 Tax=Eiseniibacteriota bacterium TaxID=2212470 RepID=A0A849SQ45_UNCEI|nr:hypothetical protein [Candidatus Eisenbacteria bacterium]